MRKTLIAIAGLALAAKCTSAAHAVPEGHEVEASVPTQQLDLGKTVPISGHVSGVSVKGYTVDIHANYSSGESGGPIHIGHADVHSSGNFSKSYTPPKGGSYTFQVEVDDKNGHAVGEGETDTLNVFRWTALQNLHPSAEGPAGLTSGKKVAGTKWAHELYVGDNGHLTLAYDSLCTQIQSYVGVSDTAPAGSIANYSLFQSSYTVRESSATQGVKAKHFTRDLDPAQHSIDIGVEFTTGGPVSLKLIFGEPKAYCAVG